MQTHICHDTNVKIRFSTSIMWVLGLECRSLHPMTHLWHKCYKCTSVCPFSKSLQAVCGISPSHGWWLSLYWVEVTVLPEPYSKCWVIVSGIDWCLVQIPNSIYCHFSICLKYFRCHFFCGKYLLHRKTSVRMLLFHIFFWDGLMLAVSLIRCDIN